MKAEKERSEQSLAALQAERERELEVLQEERQKETEEFQSQITTLQDEIDGKSQEMSKLYQELKDKEVENRIAGKKGDQLVKTCSPSSKTRDTQIATRVTDTAFVSRVSRLRRSRARALLSLNLKKQRDCLQSMNCPIPSEVVLCFVVMVLVCGCNHL